MGRIALSMTNLERDIVRVNRTAFIICLAGIPVSVWLGMLDFKQSDYPAYVSIVVSEAVVFTFFFIALLIVRKSRRIWTTLKYIIPMAGMVSLWFVPWADIVVSPAAALGLNYVLCLVAYRVSPELRYDDKILRLMVWSGGKDPDRIKQEISKELIKKLPFIKTRLTRAEEYLTGGDPAARKSQDLFFRLVPDLEPITGQSLDASNYLGRVYIGLAKTWLALEEPGKSSEAYDRARSLGALDESLNATFAIAYAEAGSNTQEAFQAYIAYLKQHRGSKSGDEKALILNVLEPICRFSPEEIADFTDYLSLTVSYAGIGAKLSKSIKDKRGERPDAVISSNQTVVQADSDISWAHFNLGLGLLFSGAPARALAEFQATQKLAPDRFQLDYYLGLAQAANNANDKALTYFEKASHVSDNADAQFHAGRLLIPESTKGLDIFTLPFKSVKKEDLSRAISFMDKALSLRQDRPDYYFYAALAQYEAGEYQTVKQLLERILCIESNVKEFYLLLAVADTLLQDYQPARELLQKILKIEASCQPAYSLLGRVCFEQRDWANAETNCRQAIKLNPKDESSRIYLGRALFSQARYSETVTELKLVKEIGDNEAVYCLGRSLMKTDRFEEAIPHLKKLTNSESSFHADYLLGCAFANIGNRTGDGRLLDEALACFNKAAEADGSYADTFLQRAGVRLLKGEYLKAFEDVQAYISNGKPSPDYLLGVYHRATNYRTAAILDFQRVLEDNSGDYMAAFALGLIKEENADFVDAERLYQSSLALNDTLDIRLRLGILHCKMGKNELAATELASVRASGVKNDSLDYYLGRAFTGTASYDKAIVEWERLLQRHPDDKQLSQNVAYIHHLRGTELLTIGDYQGSTSHWEICIKLSRKNEKTLEDVRRGLAESYFRLGLSYLEKNGKQNSQVAREAFKKAQLLGDRQTVYKYYLALANINIGDVNVAIPLLEDLISSEPENMRYEYHLASALMHGDQFAKALPLLQKIFETDGTTDRSGAAILLAECYRGLGKWEQAAEAVKLTFAGEH
jgi:tetratricopeptide (TPR) repeat protein